MEPISKSVLAGMIAMLSISQMYGLDAIVVYPDKEPVEIFIDTEALRELGRTSNNPIIFKKVRNYDNMKFLQENHIRKNYHNYQILGDSLTLNRSGHLVQSRLIEKEDGKVCSLYFDVDDVCRNIKFWKTKNCPKE